tara:strand:- start:674 stop:1108 length:435 start_codon:yes stop_codon:yes gene_type:complete
LSERKFDLSVEQDQSDIWDYANALQSDGHRPIFERVLPGRSGNQNDMVYAIYKQIANQADDSTVVDIRRECKLRLGVPLLRACNEKFKSLYDKTIRPYLTYEEKLLAMDILPVSSLMTKPQCSDYIDMMICDYTAMGYTVTRDA